MTSSSNKQLVAAVAAGVVGFFGGKYRQKIKDNIPFYDRLEKSKIRSSLLKKITVLSMLPIAGDMMTEDGTSRPVIVIETGGVNGVGDPVLQTLIYSPEMAGQLGMVMLGFADHVIRSEESPEAAPTLKEHNGYL